MTKTRADTVQPAVQHKKHNGKYFIHIFLNGQTVEADGEVYHEYDHKEIVTDSIDIEDVEAHPENYLDWQEPEPESQDELIRTLISADAEKDEIITSLQQRVEAMENAYAQMFDGLKIVSSYDNPLTLELPMYVKRNVFYRYTDGHVYVALTDGVVSEGNFDTMMADMDAPAV